METAKLQDMVGKEVQIYPGDSQPKFGIIQEVTEQGVLFKITRSQCDQYNVGSLHYIAFSARLSFKEV